MKERTKLGFNVLEAALLLGLLGDSLVRATPWGLNVFLWATAFVVAAFTLMRRRGLAAMKGEAQWLLPAVLLFAAAFVWRASMTLQFLDVVAMIVLSALAAMVSRGASARVAGVMEYALGVVVGALNAAFGGFSLLFGDISWGELPRKGWAKHIWPVVRGLLIALPLLLLFGALFMAADVIFQGIVESTFSFDADSELLISHVVMACVFAWIAGGFLRGMLFGSDRIYKHPVQSVLDVLGGSVTSPSIAPVNAVPVNAARDGAEKAAARSVVEANGAVSAAAGATPHVPSFQESAGEDASKQTSQQTSPPKGDAQQAKGASRVLSLGIVEIGVVLGLINLLFFSFVAVQVRYFFGGAEWVVNSSGLTYAEYARRGFFELVWVAALVLPLLLAAHWLLRKENPAHERIFRVLASALVALLFLVMVSAFRRMRLYQSEYGLTELRLYTTAFMGWLAVVFVWFAATVLRGSRQRFASGALVAGLCVLLGLHLLNPDAFIVRTNAEHGTGEQTFDARYASHLSADAAPALIDALPEMSMEERGQVAQELLSLKLELEANADWRSWNWSRGEALSVVRASEASLREEQARWQQHLKETAPTVQTAPMTQTAPPSQEIKPAAGATTGSESPSSPPPAPSNR